MYQKRFTIILLIVVVILVGVVVYLAFFKQLAVTQPQQPAPTSSFIGKWKVFSVEENGTQIVFEGSGATIEFFKNGTYRASGGCNEMLINSYEIHSNSKLSIAVGGTKRKCAKDIVEFWDLGKVRSYELIDNVLFLYYKIEGGVEGLFKLRKFSSS